MTTQNNYNKKEKNTETEINQNILNQDIKITPEEEQKLNILYLKKDLSKLEFKKDALQEKQKMITNLKQQHPNYSKYFDNLNLTIDEIKELSDLEKKLEQQKKFEISKINHELIDAPPKNIFQNFDDAETIQRKQESRQNHLPFSLEELRLIIARKMPEKLRAIFESHFLVRLNDLDWTKDKKKNDLFSASSGGAIVEKIFDEKSKKNKFLINLDIDSCFEEDYIKGKGGKKTKLVILNLEKLVYIITRSVLSVIKEKKGFEKICKKLGYNENIDKNCKNYDDWLAMVLLEKDVSSHVNPEFKKAVFEWLSDFNPKDIDFSISSPIIIKTRKINDKVWDKKLKSWKDKSTGEYITGWRRWLLERNATLGSFVYNFTETISRIPSALINKEYYYINIAERDAKEAKKLLSLDLGGGDYVKMIKESRYLNNKDRLRQLILVIANKGAYQWWMAQLWLWKYDWKFKSSKGKEVSSDGFDFMSRVAKAYQKAVKLPVAQPEYKKVGNKFVRFDYQGQMGKMDAILNTISTRQIQNVQADVYNNLFNNSDKKFVNIDSKLGESEFDKQEDGKKKYWLTDDACLNDLIGDNNANAFVKDMKNYAEHLNEKEFNNLVNAGVYSITRRLLQASRVEKEIFSMYTSPVVRSGFEKYKNNVSEPAYVLDQYEEDYKQANELMEKNQNNPLEIVKNSAFDDLLKIYNDYVKKESYIPYMRGTHLTAYGKLNEFIKQSKSAILEIPKIPTSLRETLIDRIDDLNQKKEITPEEINKFYNLYEEKSASLEPETDIKIRTTVHKLLGHMKNLSVVKQYQNIFRPYEYKINEYKPKKASISKENTKKILDFFLKKVMIAPVSTNDKIKSLQAKYPQINFTFKEIEYINQGKDNSEQSLRVYKLLDGKLKSFSEPLEKKLHTDYNQLNLFFNNIYEAKEQIKPIDIDKYIIEFKSLNLIPESIKNKSINTLDDIISYTQLARVVAVDYFNEIDRRKKQRENFSGLFSSYDLDYEEEMME